MIIILPQVKSEAADLLMVKAVADNSEASHSKAEAKDLSTINANFRTTGFREAHIRVAVINTVATANPFSREINQGRSRGQGPQETKGRGRGRANYQSSNDNYQYQYYTHDQQTEQYYAVVLIIPLSIATKENMI